MGGRRRGDDTVGGVLWAGVSERAGRGSLAQWTFGGAAGKMPWVTLSWGAVFAWQVWALATRHPLSLF